MTYYQFKSEALIVFDVEDPATLQISLLLADVVGETRLMSKTASKLTSSIGWSFIDFKRNSISGSIKLEAIIWNESKCNFT